MRQYHHNHHHHRHQQQITETDIAHHWIFDMNYLTAIIPHLLVYVVVTTGSSGRLRPVRRDNKITKINVKHWFYVQSLLSIETVNILIFLAKFSVRANIFDWKYFETNQRTNEIFDFLEICDFTSTHGVCSYRISHG